MDDLVADDEELDGGSRAIKLSIRALQMDMRLVEKQKDLKQPRVSLLTRACSGIAATEEK